MNTEYEIKFLQVPDNIVEIIKKLGGKQQFPKTLFKRVMFDNDDMKSKRAWLRLREEGTQITCTYKQVVADNTIEGVKEIEIIVNSFENQKKLLEQIGFKSRNYQENYREEWLLDNVKIDIDTWPIIGTYFEIEGKDEQSVVDVCNKLGLEYNDGIFHTTDVIYKQKTGRNMLEIDILEFENQLKSK